jgi:hypothetical protein
MRLVVEVESRVRDLKKAAGPAEGGEDQKNNKQQQNRNDQPDTSHGPQQEKENYSRERDGSILARQMMRSEGAQI